MSYFLFSFLSLESSEYNNARKQFEKDPYGCSSFLDEKKQKRNVQRFVKFLSEWEKAKKWYLIHVYHNLLWILLLSFHFLSSFYYCYYKNDNNNYYSSSSTYYCYYYYFRKYTPYPAGCPAIEPLFNICGSASYSKHLPWSKSKLRGNWWGRMVVVMMMIIYNNNKEKKKKKIWLQLLLLLLLFILLLL